MKNYGHTEFDRAIRILLMSKHWYRESYIPALEVSASAATQQQSIGNQFLNENSGNGFSKLRGNL